MGGALGLSIPTRKEMTRERNAIYTQPSRQPQAGEVPVKPQTHKDPRRPRLVIAMRCLLYDTFGVTTRINHANCASLPAGGLLSRQEAILILKNPSTLA